MQEQFGELAERVKQGLNQRFFDPKTARLRKWYAVLLRSVLPLAFGLSGRTARAG